MNSIRKELEIELKQNSKQIFNTGSESYENKGNFYGFIIFFFWSLNDTKGPGKIPKDSKREEQTKGKRGQRILKE